jgi:hypothetical protein
VTACAAGAATTAIPPAAASVTSVLPHDLDLDIEYPFLDGRIRL